MNTPPNECDMALAQLDALRRGELSAAEIGTLQQHLDACRHCREYQQYEAAFLARLADAARNCACPDALRRTITELLAQESRGR